MKQLQIRCALVLVVIILTAMRAVGQNSMPDVFTDSSLKEQINYLDEHTKIYDNYRAIREDMFQKLRKNISDTLSVSEKKIMGLNLSKSGLNVKIDSLNANLKTTAAKLDEMTKTKDSISVAGIEVNKHTYNKVMWLMLSILVASLAVGFLIFKRNLTAMANSKNDYQELKTEFEAYRKTSREAREKLTMDHFNEIKRIKEGR